MGLTVKNFGTFATEGDYLEKEVLSGSRNLNSNFPNWFLFNLIRFKI